MPGAAEQPGFHLASSNRGFNSRSDDIFGGLDLLASQCATETNAAATDILKADPIDEPISGSDQRRFNECPTHYYRPREPKREAPLRNPRDGHFRPPMRRPPRSQRLPDYKKNPSNWTCYDLSDVSKDDLSERSNTAAAFQFLQERRRVRETAAHAEGSSSTSEIDVDADDKSSKHVFVKKTNDVKTEENSKEEAPKFAGANRVMPEYNFGAKKRKVAQEKQPSSQPKLPDHDSIQLTHLDEEKSSDGNEGLNLDDCTNKPKEEEYGAARHQSQVAGDLPDSCKNTDSQNVVKFKSRKGKKRAAVRMRHGEEDSDDDK